MAKLKDWMIDHPGQSVGVTTQVELTKLMEKPAEVVKGWYGEYLDKRAKLAEIVDMSDEWRERNFQECF